MSYSLFMLKYKKDAFSFYGAIRLCCNTLVQIMISQKSGGNCNIYFFEMSYGSNNRIILNTTTPPTASFECIGIIEALRGSAKSG